MSGFFESTRPLVRATGAENTFWSRSVFPCSGRSFERLEFPENPFLRTGPQNDCEAMKFSDRRPFRFSILEKTWWNQATRLFETPSRALTSISNRWAPSFRFYSHAPGELLLVFLFLLYRNRLTVGLGFSSHHDEIPFRSIAQPKI